MGPSGRQRQAKAGRGKQGHSRARRWTPVGPLSQKLAKGRQAKGGRQKQAKVSKGKDRKE